ncbi:MAG: hypothetical protein JRG67_17415 [Deltaproteobacteria bacterium]|nr:hypothetical protein [Deltaproteobacteria bacterium]MBW2380112.1 hypothetical protein [Deltaproteobacteria bacterium]MBW2626764.1 hypothetical protein [Deltaproteobacteria bacterium]
MKKFALGLSLLCSVGLWVVGCGDSGSGDGGCESGQVLCDGVCIDEIQPTLTSIQTGILEVSCTASSCHDADLPAEMLDLSSRSASETSLIDVAAEQVGGNRVTSGDSSASYLMNKLLGVDMALGTTRMPQLDPDGLCTPKIDVIREWIDAGAPIN